MVRTQIQLTTEQARLLKERAAREKVSVAELIRKAVDDLLQAEPVSLEERRRRALAVVGRFHSGLTDVAEQHDEYLAEIYGEW